MQRVACVASQGRYSITYSAAAVRALSETLPVKIAMAAHAFIEGPLAENPRRVGKQLNEPFYPAYSARRGEYRIVYQIDDDQVLVEVVTVKRRSDVYKFNN